MRRRGRALRRRYGHAASRKSLMSRFTVFPIRLDRMGYDRNGRYYGTGAKLFRVYDEDDGLQFETRAADAADARAKAIAHWQKTQSYSGEYGRKVWWPFAPTVKEDFR